MAKAVYILCALTSIACALQLLRGYVQTRVNLLFWSCLCFAGLAGNNILLFVDLVLFPEIDLSLLRSACAVGALIVLIFGLIWETP